jgi:sugar-specific transcriptional regulator TrmB
LKDIFKLLEGKWEDGTRPKDVYKLYVSKDPEKYVEKIVEGLQSDTRRIQSGCAELASLLSEHNPELLYSNIDVFLENLDAKAPVLRWESVCTLGNLASVDKKKRIPKHLDEIATHLTSKSIVLQGHTVRALAKIAKENPEIAKKILDLLLASKKLFPGNRIGFLVEAMGSFMRNKTLAPIAGKLAKAYVKSEFKSVAKKAKKVMKLFPSE